MYGRWIDIKNYFEKHQEILNEDSENSFNEYTCFDVLNPSECPILLRPNAKNPPPPPPPDKDCCMQCCSGSNGQRDNNDDLLRQILAECKKANKRIGSDEYPVKLPASLRTETENFLSSLLPKPQASLENQAQFLGHMLKLFDEVIGQWNLDIEIKDTDPTKPGDQPQGMSVPNISEYCGEMLGMGVQIVTNSEIAINMLSRALYETGLSKQTGLENHSKLDTLINYLGFKTREETVKVPYTYTIGKNKLDEFLKESEVDVAQTVFDDDKNSFKKDLASLLQAAAITKAANYRKINVADAAGAAADIAKRIKELRATKNKLDKTEVNKLREEFDKFIEDYEKGFITYTGIDNPSNPYGEPYGQRPRVIKLRNPEGGQT